MHVSTHSGSRPTARRCRKKRFRTRFSLAAETGAKVTFVTVTEPFHTFSLGAAEQIPGHACRTLGGT